MNTSSTGGARPPEVVSAGRLHDTIRAVLIAHGSPESAAGLQADILVEGELRGHASHGLRRLTVIVERMRQGLIDPSAEPKLSWVAPAVLRVDGKRGFGPVTADRAIVEATRRADETGIALAAISNSSHIGMLAPYVERVARRGQIAVLLTTSEALVHAWGGQRAVVGTNPIGIGVPTSAEPLVLDMSTASVSMGKVLDYAATGRPLPEGWAVDSLGRATTDAAAAVGGSISPFGGPKGYALGIALEAMVGVVTATSFGTDVVGTLDVEFAATKGDLLVCISLERLGLQGMLPLLTRYLDDVRASAAAGAQVEIPGDRARRTSAVNRGADLTIDATLWAQTLDHLEGDHP